jgi:heavy-metal-associated domain-containing protein
MAPLSILPGRVRFEDERLFGNKERSRHLEAEIGVMPGVHLVSATHRTGRILVEFSEVQLSHDDLVARIRETLSYDIPVAETSTNGVGAPAQPGKDSLFLSRNILADVALHLLLPAPFDLLLPAVGSAFRRGQSQACSP